jgi:phospholipase/lecithinase/hemolysin
MRYIITIVVNYANVQRLYFQGARKFLVFNGPPKGCASTVLSALDGLDLPVDNAGCIIAVNELDQALNREHFKSVQRLRASLPNVTIIYFDYYAANFEIATNPSKYGFNPNLTHRACCGAPGCGVLNVSPEVKCGLPGSNRCDDPNQYIYWDGQHFTESFYRQIAKFVLNGEFSDPPINLTKACNLTFEDFGHKTYEEVFSRRSSGLFDE